MDVSRVVLVGNTIRGGHGRSGAHVRKQDRSKQDECAVLQLQLKQFLEKKLAPLARRKGKTKRIRVVFWGRSVSEDFAALAKAPAMVGSISSFSLWAAVLHKQATSAAAAPLIFLPICDLFFRKQAVLLPGISWVEASPVWSREIAGLSVEEVAARLKGLGDEAAFE